MKLNKNCANSALLMNLKLENKVNFILNYSDCILYSLNMNQSKSTDYQWNLTDLNS